MYTLSRLIPRRFPASNCRVFRELSTSASLNSDFYKTLGVNKSASAKEIKKAYYQQAKKYHPDANKDDPGAAKKFQQISEAYECLSDPGKRQQYDQLGSSAYQSAQQGGNPFGGGGGFGGTDPHDLFNQIFKEFGGMGGQQGGFSFGDFAQQMQNRPQQYDVQLGITLKEACLGTRKRVRMMIEKECSDCGGSGAKKGTQPVVCYDCNGRGTKTTMQGPFMMQTTCRTCEGTGKIIREKCGTCYGSGKVESLEEILIDVPAGISANERVRVMSHGHEIMVSFEVKEDPKLRREGLNIHSDLEVSISQAVLGGSIMANTLDGTEQIIIQPGSDSDTSIRLSRKGACKLGNKSYRGDHIVHLQIKPPKRLTQRQRDAILEFAKDEDFKGTINENEKGVFDKIKDKFTS